MPLSFRSPDDYHWCLRKIAVVGPGIVGMPMAALLAHARVRIGSEEPARIVVLQLPFPYYAHQAPFSLQLAFSLILLSYTSLLHLSFSISPNSLFFSLSDQLS
jgi:hypothetical protein